MYEEKVLGHKAYGSIPHLPGSRLGTGDHCCSEGQARIACERARDKHDLVIIQPKLDGSNVCVAKTEHGEVLALGRAGWRAWTSRWEQHRDFARWVLDREHIFRKMLEPGERVCGEWLIQAHGTRYKISDPDKLFVPFDIMRGTMYRLPAEKVFNRCFSVGLHPIPTLHAGQPISIDNAMKLMSEQRDKLMWAWPLAEGEIDEGIVWRVERLPRLINREHCQQHVDFLVKYVRTDKVDGKYLVDAAGNQLPPISNFTGENWRK